MTLVGHFFVNILIQDEYVLIVGVYAVSFLFVTSQKIPVLCYSSSDRKSQFGPIPYTPGSELPVNCTFVPAECEIGFKSGDWRQSSERPRYRIRLKCTRRRLLAIAPTTKSSMANSLACPWMSLYSETNKFNGCIHHEAY